MSSPAYNQHISKFVCFYKSFSLSGRFNLISSLTINFYFSLMHTILKYRSSNNKKQAQQNSQLRLRSESRIKSGMFITFSTRYDHTYMHNDFTSIFLCWGRVGLGRGHFGVFLSWVPWYLTLINGHCRLAFFCLGFIWV